MGFEFYAKVLNDAIEDKKLKKYLHDFILENYNDSFRQRISSLIEVFKEIQCNDLSWELMCSQIANMNAGMKQLIRFYGYLINLGVNLNIHTEYLKSNPWILLNDDNIEIYNFKNVYIPGSKPTDIFIFRNSYTRRIFNCKINNDFIREVITMFLKYREDKDVAEKELVSFISDFEESFGECRNIPNDFEEFSFRTFCNQFDYFSKKDKKSAILKNLKSFYIFLIEYIEKNNFQYEIFTSENGVDKNYIYRFNFFKLFEEGYRVVYLNKYGTVPDFDRWLVSPNGYERFTTTLKENEYIPVDFTRIKDTLMRKALKEWFMYSNDSLDTLKRSINNLFKYFEFIEGSSVKNINNRIVNLNEYANNLNEDFPINEHNILVFREYINETYDKSNTINAYISAIRSFTKFLDKKGHHISPVIYDYLRVLKKESLKSKAIMDEDLELITETLKNNMINGDVIDKLLWIFIHILLTTNYRPSEILSLKRNCIQDSMKKGEKVIRFYEEDDDTKDVNRLKRKTKTSKGKEVETNPSEYTIRAINEAISLTEELLPEAEDIFKQYIFIEKNRNGQIEGIRLDKFYRRFKRITNQLDLKNGPYTLYNCRHTYMTKLFEKAANEGDIYKAIIATGHADIVTTMKNYVKPDIRNYLEAFYKVKIGDVVINGQVAEVINDVITDLPNDLREITVKQGCGFCKGQCDMNEQVDCLLCRNFVVVLDRIPYFEKSIEEINNIITNEEILHEKEHLISIKKLYVAYLARLYSYKQQKENCGNER